MYKIYKDTDLNRINLYNIQLKNQNLESITDLVFEF